jgi:menaquinone-dependent protoporphyrinogen oxidase
MKVLVSAASRHGASAEIATIVGDLLRDTGIDADVIAPEHVASVDGYDAVILGSGVYGGSWLSTAKTFARTHRDDLVRRPVFLFSCGPLGEPPRPIDAPDAARLIGESVGAMDVRTFAGRLIESELDLGERLVAAAGRKPVGDFRPWDDIVDWTRAITAYLEGRPVGIETLS